MHVIDTIETDDIEYPSSDGKPMAETDLHWDWMVTIAQRLKKRYAGRRVYVASNLFIYYEEGNRKKCVAPDAFVVKNCRPGRRKTFLTWKEQRLPNFVLETTSKKTRREDKGKKMKIYARIGIPEYFLYDPTGDWLKPHALKGYRLQGSEYEVVPPDADGGILSLELGVRFMLEHGDLAMFDAKTGERLLSQEEWRGKSRLVRAEEERSRAEEEKRWRQLETRRADDAEQHARALEAEMARLREAVKKINDQKRKNGK